MVVRRSDSRRRRVVVDPAFQNAESIAIPMRANQTDSKPESNLYANGANRRHQNKTTDLIPKRVRAVCLLVGVLLAAIGLLNVLAFNASGWAEQIGWDGVASLGLTGRGTLASWFSSFLLIISGLASLQIYALRQHRRDDYRGSYRLWLWMAMLLLLGSINCVVDLTTLSTRLFQALTNVSLTNNPWWPLAIKLGLLTALVARGIYEIRESRGSLALVVFVWIAYSAAAVMQLPATDPVIVNLNRPAILGNCYLFATVAILLAELTFARYIYLQAHGLIKAKPVKVKSVKVKPAPRAVDAETQNKETAAKSANKKSARKSMAETEKEIAGEEDEDSISTSNSRSRKSNTNGKKSKMKTDSDSTRELRISRHEENEDASIIQLSKSELRRQRKQKDTQPQQQRRAA